MRTTTTAATAHARVGPGAGAANGGTRVAPPRRPSVRRPAGRPSSAPVAPPPGPAAPARPGLPDVQLTPESPARCATPAVPAARRMPKERVAPKPALTVAPLRTRPSRLTTRGRVVLTIAFLAVVLTGLALGRASVPAASTASPVAYETVTVQPGQTLWQIAVAVAPGVDPRTTVARTVAANGLADANVVTVGDVLRVPLG